MIFFYKKNKIKISIIIISIFSCLLNLSFAEQNDLFKINPSYSNWAVSKQNTTSSINIQSAWSKSINLKKEIKVAVIDTGIDPSHPHLKNNIYLHNSKVNQNNFGVDFSKGNISKFAPYDYNGHGTHIAGIIKTVFPSVKILSLKYFNPKASGRDNLKSTIAALKYAVDVGVDIINYSGGGPDASTKEMRIIKRAKEKGILIITAAGNEHHNIDQLSHAYFPASYKFDNILAVTTHDQNNKMLMSSNYGKQTVDIAAPGLRIKSSLPNNRSGYLSGTSQSTAFVTGVAALIMSQFPELSYFEVKQIIKLSAQKESSLIGLTSSQGRLDAESAINLAHELFGKVQNREVANN
jgi:subtilisin family serine protease